MEIVEYIELVTPVNDFINILNTRLVCGDKLIFIERNNNHVRTKWEKPNPTTPTTPRLSNLKQPNALSATGKLEFVSFNDKSYSIDNGVTYQSSTLFEDLTPGIYNLKMKNILGGLESQVLQIEIFEYNI